MRHGKKVNHLGRTASHRKALMANMASSLIKSKRITTTVAKAKALRTYVEPLLTRSKDASTHNYRTVFSYLKDKEAVKELFTVVGEKISNRPGGYTRILKIGNRMGDNADMAFIELVDFNEFFEGFGKDRKAASKKTRRGKTSKSAATAVVEKSQAQTTVNKTEEAPAISDVVEESAPEAEATATVSETTEVSSNETAVEETTENSEVVSEASSEEVSNEDSADSASEEENKA
jgi:large subunit ribosomal protein L17